MTQTTQHTPLTSDSNAATPQCPGIDPGTTVHIPPINNPVGFQIHPDWRAVQANIDAWLPELCNGDEAMAQRINLCHPAFYVCTAMPNGIPHRVLDIAQLTSWWFELDDEFTRIDTDPTLTPGQRQQRLSNRVAHVWDLVTGATHDDPVYSGPALTAMLGRIRNRISPHQAERFITAMGAWSNDPVGLDLSATGGDMIEACLRGRGPNGGCRSFNMFTEYVLGIDLPPATLKHELMNQFWDISEQIWALPNDILSFRKECVAGEHNNIICVQRKAGRSLQEAINWAVDYLHAQQQRCLDLRERILTANIGPTDDLNRYFDEMFNIAGATVEHAYYAKRYHGPQHQWNSARTGTIALYPDRTDFHFPNPLTTSA
ncbi:terpene synthase family protein [Streptomyces sp. NPDC001205]